MLANIEDPQYPDSGQEPAWTDDRSSTMVKATGYCETVVNCGCLMFLQTRDSRHTATIS